MTNRVIVRAPTRIDFGGGWTDVPPYSDELGGFVCNVAITRYATATVTRRAGPPHSLAGEQSIARAAARRFGLSDASIEVTSDFPIGAGLGGSSAVGVATVAALAALTGRALHHEEIAELSREIEIADLGVAGGRQDHYAAAFGGALGLEFSREGVAVERIPLDAATCRALEARCVIVYTGQSRISGDTINAVLAAYAAGEPAVLRALARMKETARAMAAALREGDVDALGPLIEEQWIHQRSLHPAIPTPLIDRIIAAAAAAGAAGSKALGASGGGCVLILARAGREAAVREAVASMGELVSFSIDHEGAKRCE